MRDSASEIGAEWVGTRERERTREKEQEQGEHLAELKDAVGPKDKEEIIQALIINRSSNRIPFQP